MSITLVQMAIVIAMVKNLETRREALTSIEWIFIKSLSEWNGYFSEKQYAWVLRIHDRVVGNESVEVDIWALM